MTNPPPRSENARRGWITTLAVFGIAIVGFGAASVAMGEDAGWDLKNYHIYDGYAFLTGRWGRDIAPAQLQEFHNPTLDAATYLLIAALRPVWCGFVLGAIQGVNFGLVYLISWALLRDFGTKARFAVSLLSAMTGAYGAVGVCELGTLFHDVTLAVLVLLALLLLLKGSTPTRKRSGVPWIEYGSGLALGAGIGLKNTLAMYVVGFAAGFFVLDASLPERVKKVASWGFGLAAGVLLSGGHWMYRLYREFGNPVFPYYNSIFKSPYAQMNSWVDDTWVPKTVVDAVKFPFSFAVRSSESMAMPFQDLRFPVVWLSGLTVFAIGAVHWVAKRISASEGEVFPAVALERGDEASFLIFFFASYIVWQSKLAAYRFLAALELLAPLAVLVLLSKVVRDRRQLVGPVVIVFAILAVTMRPPDFGRVPFGKRFISVTTPKLPDPGKSTVVMTSGAPMSYVIPSFPPKVRFVRIEGNLYAPEPTPVFAARLRAALLDPGRDYYLLTPPDSVKGSDLSLGIYGFKAVEPSCEPLQSNLAEKMMFCRLERGAPPSTSGPSGILSVDTVKICKNTGFGVATVRWLARGTQAVEIHMSAPNGSMWVSGGAQGSNVTGEWVSPGTTFFLQNVAKNAPLTAEK